jgi:hypothetical protein
MIKILFSKFEAIVLSWKHAVQAHKPVPMASKSIMVHIKGSVSQYPILEIQSSQTAQQGARVLFWLRALECSYSGHASSNGIMKMSKKCVKSSMWTGRA